MTGRVLRYLPFLWLFARSLSHPEGRRNVSSARTILRAECHHQHRVGCATLQLQLPLRESVGASGLFRALLPSRGDTRLPVEVVQRIHTYMDGDDRSAQLVCRPWMAALRARFWRARYLRLAGPSLTTWSELAQRARFLACQHTDRALIDVRLVSAEVDSNPLPQRIILLLKDCTHVRRIEVGPALPVVKAILEPLLHACASNLTHFTFHAPDLLWAKSILDSTPKLQRLTIAIDRVPPDPLGISLVSVLLSYTGPDVVFRVQRHLKDAQYRYISDFMHQWAEEMRTSVKWFIQGQDVCKDKRARRLRRRWNIALIDSSPSDKQTRDSPSSPSSASQKRSTFNWPISVFCLVISLAFAPPIGHGPFSLSFF